MTCQYFAAIFLSTTIAGFTTYIHDDTVCPVRNDQMPCKMTVRSLYVNIGENLILNCTCTSKSNGQWIGPNRSFINTTGDHFMPYTQGMQMNPNLNKSKFRVVGNINNTKCNLEILNFLSDDEGTYKCQYVDSDAVNIHKYNVLKARPLLDGIDSTEKGITYTIHNKYPSTIKNEHCRFALESLHNYVWQIIGSLLAVGLLLSICLNIYCLLKPKGTSQMVSEGQYDEIGAINGNSEILHVSLYSADEEEINVRGQVFERIYRNVTSVEQEASSVSSVSSVHSLSISGLNDDGYENPYQPIYPENIEMHPYSTVWSTRYQNIIFPPDIGINSDKGPWLFIYKKKV